MSRRPCSTVATRVTQAKPLGLPFEQVGQIMQGIGRCIIDREDLTEKQVLAFFTRPEYSEERYWDGSIGRIVDHVEIEIQDWLESQRKTVLFTDEEHESLARLVDGILSQDPNSEEPDWEALKTAQEKLRP